MKSFKELLSEVVTSSSLIKLAISKSNKWIMDRASIVVNGVEFKSLQDSEDPDDWMTDQLDPFREVSLGEYLSKEKIKKHDIRRVKLVKY